MRTELIVSFAVCIWAAVAFTLYFIEFARIPVKLRIRGWQPFNRKPFTCEACLPVWVFAAFLIPAIYGCTEMVAGIASALTAGIITPLLLTKIQKL